VPRLHRPARIRRSACTARTFTPHALCAVSDPVCAVRVRRRDVGAAQGDIEDGADVGRVVRGGHAWIPEAGLDFALRMDGLAWMFCLLILAIGALVVLYARYYLSAQDSARRFYSYLLAFMGAMLGIVLAGNLLLMVVFWELTSITSFLLIGFWSHRQDARQGARMALTITGLGGLALLGGVLLIGRIVGSYDLDAVLAAGDLIRAHALYPFALALVLTGVFSKSAQFPLHLWLPHAMAAPTPVSAYLHSATMVKAGIFLLARLHPALAGTELFFYVVSSIGAMTLVFGSASALFQHDLKGMLAYSTIAHLGLMTLLFGLSTPLAVAAGIFHILNHAAFKAALFMSAGIIGLDRGRAGDGRGAAAERVFVQGAAVRAGARHRRPRRSAFRAGVGWGLPTARALCMRPSSARGRARWPMRRTSRRAGCSLRSRCWRWRACWSASRPVSVSGLCWSSPPSARWARMRRSCTSRCGTG